MADKQKKWNRTFVSLSFSVPPDLEEPMNQRAADAGFRSRSEYLCKLVEDDIRKHSGKLPEETRSKKLPRIVRGTKRKASSKSTSDV
jgi:metal-responsive CopG/Arc/MetJ family transcriptional regulator